jgi:RNA polymerase sigma-70 factor (ECF subfamily)
MHLFPLFMHLTSKGGPADGESDEALISKIHAGDRKAFSSLLKRYEETVYRFAFKVCRDPGRAEEAMQDTFINVFRKLDSFDRKSKFSTWLYAIVTNNCRMKHRQRKSRAVEESLDQMMDPSFTEDGRMAREMAQWDDTPEDRMLGKELREVLEQSIARLPEEYRLVFVLRDVDGNSTEDTASIMGITVEATKSRLRRARAFLREQLNPYMAGQERRERA